MKELLYGRQPVREVLRAGRRQVYGLLLAQGIQSTGIVAEALTLAQRNRIPIRSLNRREMDQLSGEANHQGLAAEVSAYPYLELVDLLDVAREAGQPPFLLLLDHILDPQNLGSLLRSAEAVGVHGVVLTRRRAAAVTPAVVRASAGAAEHIRVAQVPNLAQAIKTLKGEGVWLAGLEARPGARLYTEADLTGPLGLVVGSEGGGLGRLIQESCDFLIQLPMHGQVSSLNAAVAGALALYEAHRQRTQMGRTTRDAKRPLD